MTFKLFSCVFLILIPMEIESKRRKKVTFFQVMMASIHSTGKNPSPDRAAAMRTATYTFDLRTDLDGDCCCSKTYVCTTINVKAACLVWLQYTGQSQGRCPHLSVIYELACCELCTRRSREYLAPKASETCEMSGDSSFDRPHTGEANEPKGRNWDCCLNSN